MQIPIFGALFENISKLLGGEEQDTSLLQNFVDSVFGESLETTSAEPLTPTTTTTKTTTTTSELSRCQELSTLQPAGAPTIHCKENGSFAEMQCDFRTCWCVTEDGAEIPLSRKNHPQFPSCGKFKGATNTLELACQDDPICDSIGDLSDGPACMLSTTKRICPATCDPLCKDIKPKERLFETACFDISSVCHEWLDSCHLAAVTSLCAKTCQICGEDDNKEIDEENQLVLSDCKDSVARCPEWKNDCHSELTQKLCSSTCGLCSEYKTNLPDVIEDELSPSSCRDIYDFCPKIGFTCDESTTRAMCSETCNVCGTNLASENGDSNVNCLEWKNFCDMPFVRNSCYATCESFEASFSGDDDINFSGDGSGEYSIESSDETKHSLAEKNRPYSCRGFALPVDFDEKSIYFNGASTEEVCQWSINRPEENQLVMLTVDIVDVRTVNDCSFFVDVFDEGNPLIRLCGSGTHQTIVGTQFDINVMSYEGFGVEIQFDLISIGAFGIMKEVNEYTSLESTDLEECKDAQFCDGLKSRCADDLIFRSCPMTCNKCAPIEYAMPSCQDKLGSLACNEVREACNSDWTVMNLCQATCGKCAEETADFIAIGFKEEVDKVVICEDDPGCAEIEDNRCTAISSAEKMRKSCPIKCGHCQPDGSVMDCVDKIDEDICNEISEGCSQAHVASNCARTCKTCPVSSERCIDSSEFCSSWTEFCSEPFVEAVCSQTCGSC